MRAWREIQKQELVTWYRDPVITDEILNCYKIIEDAEMDKSDSQARANRFEFSF